MGALKRDAPLQVVTQVFTHTRHIGFDRHAQLTQAIGLANTRELQQLRRHDGPGAQDHFAPGQHLQRLALVQVANTYRPRPLPHHRCGLSLHLQGEPRRGKPIQISPGGAAALTLMRRQLQIADALVASAVVVGVGGNAGFQAPGMKSVP